MAKFSIVAAFLCGSIAFAPGCGNGDGAGDDDAADNPGAPKFLSFGTNVSQLTDDETVTFTAVVSDPDGKADVLGGTLESPDGAVRYGAFVAGGEEGAYSLALHWDEIDQAVTIDFDNEASREFVARFFDNDGNSATQTTTLRLHCDGRGDAACDGSCTRLSDDRQNCGACGDVCAAAATLSTGHGGDNVALDATHMYWTSQSNGRVGAVELATGIVTLLVSQSIVVSQPLDIAVDATHVYYSDVRANAIKRIAKSGEGEVETLATDQVRASGLAIDDSNVYWREDGTNNIATTTKEPGGQVTLLISGQGSDLATLAVDDTNIYWASGGGIHTMPKAGGDRTALAVGQINVKELVLDDTHVYWAAATHTARVDKTGAKVDVLATGLPTLSAIAVDDEFVYVSSNTEIVRVAKKGGTPGTIASGQSVIRGVAADVASVYWLDNGTQEILTGCKCVL